MRKIFWAEMMNSEASAQEEEEVPDPVRVGGDAQGEQHPEAALSEAFTGPTARELRLSHLVGVGNQRAKLGPQRRGLSPEACSSLLPQRCQQ